MGKIKVAVIGAGIIGLSTACNIQKLLPQAQVTVIADRFSPNTTSDVAAGLWLIFVLQDTPMDLQLRWSGMTYKHLQRLSATSEGSQAGVYSQSGYLLYSDQPQKPKEADLVLGFRELTSDELSLYPGHSSGYFLTSYMCEPYIYLPWLLSKIRELGGTVVQKHVTDLKELYDDYDVIINCAGLGARDLVTDKTMIPVKGQVYKVKAPWVKHFHFFDVAKYYIIPGVENTVVGGTFEYNNWDLTPSSVESQRIWTGACQRVPSLAKAKIVREASGLRPARPAVRLETEFMHHGKKIIPVIHNYGHGGAGVTVHWGCAVDAAEMVRAAIQKNHHTTSRL